MLTNVVWVPPVGIEHAEFPMSLFTPDANGMFIDHIDGLGPVDDNISTKPFGSGDGEYFVGRHRGKRNIVLHFGFESRGYDVAAARDALIRTFYTVGDTMFFLRFEFDDKDPVIIGGYLETTESDLFVSDPEGQLSIICPRPNFVATEIKTATGVTDNDPALIDLENEGNREVGFGVKIIPDSGIEDHFADDLIYETKIATSVVGVFNTFNTLHVRGWTQDLDEPMVAGEEWWLDTRVGRKRIYIKDPATGDERNSMRGMTSDSRWPKIYPGTSKFSIRIPYWAQGVHTQEYTVYWQDEFGSI